MGSGSKLVHGFQGFTTIKMYDVSQYFMRPFAQMHPIIAHLETKENVAHFPFKEDKTTVSHL